MGKERQEFMKWLIKEKLAEKAAKPEKPQEDDGLSEEAELLEREMADAEEEGEEEIPTIVLDEENENWMRTLPGYQDEVKIHERLAAEHKRKLAAGEVDIYGRPTGKKS